MATKVHLLKIPDSFQKLDTVVGSADTYLSVYERRKMLENFNALLARRARRNLVAQIFAASDNVLGLPQMQLNDVEADGYPEWRTLIRVNPNTRVLYICAYLSQASAVGDFEVKPFFVPLPVGDGEYVPNSTMLTQNSTATRIGARTEMELEISPGEGGWGLLILRAQANVAAAATGSGDAIRSRSLNMVEISDAVSGGGYAVGDAIEFSDTNIQRQPIISVYATGETDPVDAGNRYIIEVPDAWKPYPPAPGTDTVGWRSIVNVRFSSVSVMEKPLAEFGTP